MTLKIQHKRSAVKGKAPQPTDLEYGEIAVNYETSAPCIYIKDSANTIRRIGGASVTTSDTAPVSPDDGHLWYDSVGGRTYVYYQDPTGGQWVDMAPQGGGDGGGTSPSIAQGNTSAEVIDTGTDGRFVVKTEGTAQMTIKSSGIINFTNVPQFTDNASALAGGLVPGDLFKNIAGILVIAS
jgi:hypothetical protein